MANDIVILGVFNADTAYVAARQPRMGETLLGERFVLGPGGKGSNQAVAAARAGGDVGFLTKLGRDTFADMALATWAKAGVTSLATHHEESHTGAAYIFVEAGTGDNAIIICPGIANTISPADVEAQAEAIAGAKIFVTQLEQPVDAAHRGLEIARRAGVRTILNPAPAVALPETMLALCDFVTPNETEAEGLTGLPVETVEDAARAGEALMARGAGAAIVTLGARGALYHDGETTLHVPALMAGPVVETTGAGDAFNGGLALALAEGRPPVDAVRFANATAALSVTRRGSAPSMPERFEIDALLAR